MQTEIVTFHLEMTSPAPLRPREASVPDLELKQARIPCGELNEFLYRAVGADWHWIDRLGWDRSRWQAWAARPELETWVAYVSGTPAGYFELERQEGRAVEIDETLNRIPTSCDRQGDVRFQPALPSRYWRLDA